MKWHYSGLILLGVQSILGIRVLYRLIRSAGGTQLHVAHNPIPDEYAGTTIILPVLNEEERLIPCLEGLLTQGDEVREILVVDGGSSDGTRQLMQTYVQQDARIRLIDATPVPDDWNGKCWGLHVGLQEAHPKTRWIVTIDADVRPQPLLIRSLLAHSQRTGVSVLSIATLQEIDGTGQGLLHPSLLTTLVYRFGIPGKAVRKIHEVQANGQCFLARRDILSENNGFLSAASSLNEDVTIARALVAKGHTVGFYEAGSLVTVEMYTNWRDTWHNWTRSLPMHDRFSGLHTFTGWLDTLFIQALPLPLLLLAWMMRRYPKGLVFLNAVLAITRIGVLFGTARAYVRRPWSYWLSPLCDLPVALQLGRSLLQRRHTWRGRTLIRGGQ